MVHKNCHALEAGRELAHPPPGDEVVITGMAGAFPDSDNVEEFADKLFNKVDLISGDGRRWALDHPEIPQRTGKLNNISKFDAGYFGIHYKQAHAMDPMCRIVLEKAAEAVFDAGYNPQSLYGKNIGVFVGACFSETEKTWFYERLQVNGFGVTGCARAMLANRISYWLGVQGPSYTVDTACSSSLYAIEHGYRAIREGQCEAAIIAGTNLCLHPYVSLQFSRLGVLSKDGKCKTFDETANGYCRSEAIAAMFLQKKKDSRRIYATLIHAKTNCDGYKEQGITFPSGPLQQELLEEFYEECEIDPSSLAWIEAHGTGTKVGDPEEVAAIENVFCANRKDPLKIGSLKSNTGHSEPTSGLLSITKVLIAMETGYIPPNINFNMPRKDIPALHNGKITIITEKTPWELGLVGVNSFGFGGANCHVLLKGNEKTKINGGLPTDDLPRLVNLSGRTHAGIDLMLSNLENNPIDVEFIKLYHGIFKDEVPGHIFRGFTVITRSGLIERGIRECPTLKQPFWYFFPAFGYEWKNELERLMKISIFSQVVMKCRNILKREKVDIVSILSGNVIEKDYNRTFVTVLMNCVTQIIMVSILQKLGIGEPNGIIGMSYGEIACAYADGSLTLEQALVTAFHVATALSQLENQRGSTALIGLPYTQVKGLCPNDVSCIYHGMSCTIVSGPALQIKSLMEKAKHMDSATTKLLSDVALHSSRVNSVISNLREQLKKVITENDKSSSKWISTSAKEATNFFVSADYFCNNLVNQINFEPRFNTIEHNSIVVEFAPEEVAGVLLNKAMKKNMSFIQSLEKNIKDPISSYLVFLGKLYNLGGNLDLALLYPNVEYPVARSTRMISPLLRWYHEDDWYVTSYKTQDRITTGERFVSLSLKDEEQEYISGHVIDGRNLFPATGYLFIVWESAALMKAKLYSEVPVVFENVRFHRATNIPKDGGSINFTVTIQRSSGFFEILEGGASIVTGRIFVPEDVNCETSNIIHDKTMDPSDDQFVMKSRDIYKELRLRGYNYKGLFRGVSCCNLEGTRGFVKWHNNWVAFMDNMLQLQILDLDSRGLFVPTMIQRVVIDIKKHLEIVTSLPEDKDIPVYNYRNLRLVCAGGIEVRGLNASAIAKKKPLGEPVFENQKFIPYHIKNEEMDPDAIIRMFVHIALENVPSVSVKVSEVGALGDKYEEYLALPVAVALADLPLIQPDITIYNPIQGKLGENNPPEIKVAEDKKMPTEQSALFAIGCELMDPANQEVLQACMSNIKENGFIITRDIVDRNASVDNMIKCSSISYNGIHYALWHKIKPSPKKNASISVSNESFAWVEQLQNLLKSDDVKRVLIFAQNQPLSGILGLVNCILKEGYTEKARCFYIIDPKAPAFSLDNPFYAEQISKDLAVNIYNNGAWGSYRHLLLESNAMIDTPHAYVAFATRGDLSSLHWSEGHLSKPINRKENPNLIHIYYSALNFRDIMTATGKLANEVVEKNRLYQDVVQGLEFSGRDSKGKRVMGLVAQKALGSVVDVNGTITWEVPDEWSLEDAATIPCVYGTIVYAFSLCGKPKKGESLLIHAGSGGIGQAAIHYALHHGCKVYTTVGTQEKRDFIKKTFKLTDNQIGNSRDTSFEQLIMRETNGRGVDFVLNSLAEEKLLASVRCLARGGRFIELGKFDMANDSPLGMEFLLRDACFIGVMLNVTFYSEDKWRKMLWTLLDEGLRSGGIHPLSKIVFENDQVEDAMRFMAGGKHVGKVLIKMREEEPKAVCIPDSLFLPAKPRFYCNKKKTYVILGGLGGFGLELADWLILRQAKNIVLSSRSGVKNGYQALRIKIWNSYGVNITVATDDVTTREGVVSLLKKANAICPVGGIFNLAVVLKDAVFENQNEEDFKTSFGPKAVATQYLDEVSRKMCPELDHFVIYSSVSCGRGNAGQTNYGMSNSVMERICEKRMSEGFPALAIQWGAVGDVGLVANMQEENSEIVIGGTLPQKIDSCLAALDMFLNGKHPVVASMVVAEKKSGSGGAGNLVDTVVNIIGLRDLKSVSLHSTLAELGMDSMMAVEIKQTLEREFEVFLTPQDIRSMTFAKLQDIASAKNQEITKPSEGDERSNEPILEGLQLIVRNVGDESTAPYEVINMKTLCNKDGTAEISSDYQNRVFLLPGIEGVAPVFQNMSPNLNFEALCVQYDYTADHDSVKEVAHSVYQRMKKYISKDYVVYLVGYSFGGIVSLEVTALLESMGYQVALCNIDGSPDVFRELVKHNLGVTSKDDFQVRILLGFVDILWPQDKTKLEGPLKELRTWEARMDLVLSATENNLNYSGSYKKACMTAIYRRLRAVAHYQGIPLNALHSPLILIRPYTSILVEYEEDYGLSKYFKKEASVQVVEGNHLTILDNLRTAELLNNFHSKDLKN